jgi:hypothetical protein
MRKLWRKWFVMNMTPGLQYYKALVVQQSTNNIMKWVTSNKSSLLLKIDLQNTQTLQLN